MEKKNVLLGKIFFSNWKKTGKQNLYVDVVFGNTNTYQNRKQIQTPITIDGKFWNKDNNELKRSHPNYEVLSYSIRDLRNKIEKAVDRFTLGQINRDQLIANISGKTDYRSVDDYLDTELRTTRKGKTFQSYSDAFKTFKRYVGSDGKNAARTSFMEAHGWPRRQHIGQQFYGCDLISPTRKHMGVGD